MSGLTYRSKQTKLYKYRKANGIQVFTDAAPVQAHILGLRALGVTDSMIAHVSGNDPQNIAYIADGTTQRVWQDNARRILAVTHHPHPAQHFVLTIGFTRRYRALTAIGWPSAYIAERIGVSGKNRLNSIAAQPAVTYRTWSAMRDLYDELSGTPGPSRRSIADGRRHKYMPPLAWDDIDDPRAQPDWAAVGIPLTQRPMCAQGHWYPAEPARDSRGTRMCRECRRDAQARRRVKLASGR
ncbi:MULTISPECIES: hypothetical protein [Nocardia]|uniref:hypothetical protein n=1 Tax=Nocardia TaxID=1817 RepID=UPI000D689E9C|nr:MULTISPECIES: hypothetical protein [Nocardia]